MWKCKELNKCCQITHISWKYKTFDAYKTLSNATKFFMLIGNSVKNPSKEEFAIRDEYYEENSEKVGESL